MIMSTHETQEGRKWVEILIDGRERREQCNKEVPAS